MFDKDRFIENCKNAVFEGLTMIRELVAKAVHDRSGVMAAFGEPVHAGITSLYSSPELTIINFIWAPCMSLMPHNHQMFSVVGIYSGREDNVFWRRTANSIEAKGAKSLAAGEVTVLGWDVIHSVLNPIEKMTCAIHVYGFMAGTSFILTSQEANGTMRPPSNARGTSSTRRPCSGKLKNGFTR